MLKNHIITAASALFLLGGAATAAFAGPSKAEDTMHRTIPVEKREQVEVETLNGSITVQGYDEDVIDIRAIMSVTGPKQETCEELLKDFEVKIKEGSNSLRIEADTPVKIRYNCSVSFNIRTPRNLKAICKSTNGDIEINDLLGGMEVSTVNGAVRGSNITGGAKAETINGAIKLMGVQGNTYGEAVNGSIEVVFNAGNPQTVHLETVNGKIEARYQSVLDAVVSAETINGSLEVAGSAVKKSGLIGNSFSSEFGSGKSRYTFETVNGEIQLDFPKSEESK